MNGMNHMNDICPDLVAALQCSGENEGDSERLRIALNGMDFLAVDPASETLMVMRAASVQVKNGRPRITMICQRVATGNEYRDWQQSGSVPLIAGDAGSNPAVGSFLSKRFDNEKPGRKLNDYRKIKLNSVGYPIGLLPDDPDKRHLVSQDTNWEHVPPTLILEALTSALEPKSLATEPRRSLPQRALCKLTLAIFLYLTQSRKTRHARRRHNRLAHAGY